MATPLQSSHACPDRCKGLLGSVHTFRIPSMSISEFQRPFCLKNSFPTHSNFTALTFRVRINIYLFLRVSVMIWKEDRIKVSLTLHREYSARSGRCCIVCISVSALATSGWEGVGVQHTRPCRPLPSVG